MLKRSKRLLALLLALMLTLTMVLTSCDFLIVDNAGDGAGEGTGEEGGTEGGGNEGNEDGNGNQDGEGGDSTEGDGTDDGNNTGNGGNTEGDDTGNDGIPDVEENPSTLISNILGGTDGESYTVRGTVVAYNAQSFLIKDSTGTVLVYKGYTWSPDLDIGDVVEVSGARATYGNAPQFGTDATYEKVGSVEYTQPTPVAHTPAELNAYANASTVTPVYVKLTGTLSLSTSNDKTYYNFNIASTTIIGSLTYPTANDVINFKAMDGDTLEVEGWITSVTGYGKYLNLITVSYKKVDGGASGGSDSTGTSGVVIGGEEIPAYAGDGYYTVNNNVPFFTESDKAFTGYKYSPLDSLGRATGAFARLTSSLCPTDDRDSISHIRPTGWNYNTSYSVTNGQVLYNRSHLLAHSLMSDDVHPENFISGTMYMNQTVMTDFENLVRGIVKSGSDVLYRVTPIYIGDNLLASGLLIEAYSIEDGGDDVCFCVYLYNVQPGIEIDYSTGRNWLAGSGSGSDSGNTGSGDSGSDDSGSDDSGSGSAGDSANGDVVFTFGANGSAAHKDGTDIGAEKSFTEGGYTLTLTGASKIYDGATDQTGISCLKVGTSKAVGTFSFTVGDDVTKVIIKVAGYKANTGKIEINGTSYTVSTQSNSGDYTAIEVDTSSTKTVSFTTLTGGYRVMIDSIEFVVEK